MMLDSQSFQRAAINLWPVDKRLLEMLITEQIYYAPPHKLNDPFDCQIDLKKSLSAAINFAKSENRNILLNLQDFMSTELEQIAVKIQKCGVFSFSIEHEPKNSLMWAHYGDNHRGVSLTYALPDELVDHKYGRVVGVSPVDYGENIIRDHFLMFSHDTRKDQFNRFGNELIIKALTAKARCWKYEKEGRSISVSPGSQTVGKKLLKQVCFGLRTTFENRRLIEKLLSVEGYTDVTLAEMTASALEDFGLMIKAV